MYVTFESKIKSEASYPSPSEVSYNFSGNASVKAGMSSSDETRGPPSVKAGATTAMSTSDESRLLVAKPARNEMVSLSTCSMLCAIFFVAGVVVGNTLKKGICKWVSKLLRRSKDD